MIVAIDGPAGSGKSTLARGLAETLGLVYLNTGLMYRGVARRALDAGADPDDEPALVRLVSEMRFGIDGSVVPPSLTIDGYAPGEELTRAEVEAIVSAVSRHPGVRALLREEQRRLGVDGAVVEGRDIGTVVFPHAGAKIFLVAEAGERAARRQEERGSDDPALADALARRDASDARTNPLVPAEDARLLDTSERTSEEVLAEALAIVRELAG